MTFNPYEVLGVAQNSNQSEIRKAYRRKVLISHPDAGGTIEDFHILQKAYEILSNVESRRIFDETGDVISKEFTTEQIKIIEILSVCLDRVLQKVPTKTENPYHQLNELIYLEIENQRFEIHKHRQNIEHTIQIYENLIDRFKIKNDRNLMREAIARRISSLKNQFQNIDSKLKELDKSIDFIKKLEFENALSIEFDATLKKDNKFHPLLDWGDLIKFK